MTNDQKSRLHAIVEGRVQGVGFRYFVHEKASALSISGWVRNKYSGDVEVVAEGDRQTLETLLVSLRRGPRGAFVTQVLTEWLEPTGEYQRFDIRHSV